MTLTNAPHCSAANDHHRSEQCCGCGGCASEASRHASSGVLVEKLFPPSLSEERSESPRMRLIDAAWQV